MQLLPIDKNRYSKNIKTAFIAICVYLLIIALGISTILIHFFGAANGDNFWLNIAGVVIAAFSIGLLYKKFKTHPFLKDIVYVRAIKSQLNYIYRKQRKLLAAAEDGDVTAMSVLDFSYRAAKYVYELDDNTLTTEELLTARNQLKVWTDKFNVTDFVDYNEELLKDY